LDKGTPRFNSDGSFAGYIGSCTDISNHNAIKHHTRSDGHVKISVKDQGQYYEFAVSDNGSGIAPEYHDKIFVIFQTLEARDLKEGTGIGLAIVKKIVEMEAGKITGSSASFMVEPLTLLLNNARGNHKSLCL